MTARLQILLAAMMFGTTGTAQALADVNSPYAVGAVRIIIGGALLVILAQATRSFGGLRRHPGIVAVSGFAVAVSQLAFFAAVDRTGVVVGTVVATGTTPIAAGLFDRAINGVTPSRRWALATTIAATGIVVLATGSGDGATVTPEGVALAVTAGSALALYTVVAKRMIDEGCSSTGAIGAAFGVGALILLPVLSFVDTGWLGSGRGLLLGLYLGAIPTALAYILYARGLRRVSAGETATIAVAEPMTATLLGALVLHERLSVLAGLGVALVAAAMLLLMARRPVTEPSLEEAPA